MKVAEKNVLNEIPKWPQVIPAKSNRGFGIEAQSKTVMNPYFYRLLYIKAFTFEMKSFLSLKD